MSTDAPLGGVVHVCLDPGVPVFGRKGCSVHVQEVLRQLVRRAPDGRVHLVAARTGGTAPAGLEGVVVHELGRPRADGAAERERALAALDERAADLVEELVAGLVGEVDGEVDGPAPVLVYQRYGLWSAAVLQRAAAAGARTVLEVNAPLVAEQARFRELVDAQGATATTRRALRVAAEHGAVCAVSGAVAAWARTVGDLAEHEVLVTPNGVDTDRFHPAAGDAPRGDGTGAGDGVFWTAFVGTFRPWHGTAVLVDAVAQVDAVLRTTGSGRAGLVLVGDGPERGRTLEAAAAAGLPVRAPGAVAPGEVPALLAGCDAAAAPYPADPADEGAYFSPLKLAEYLAAGLPVVAAAVADVPALFADGRELLLVEPGDTPALADRLLRLALDPALRARLGAAGRAAAEQRCSWDGVVATAVAAATRPVLAGATR